jgi:hypothetical protein
MDEERTSGLSMIERTSLWLSFAIGVIICSMGLWMTYANSSTIGTMYPEFGGEGASVQLGGSGLLMIGMLFLAIPAYVVVYRMVRGIR